MDKKKSVRLITVCAMLIAVEIVLNRLLSFNTLGVKVGFSFVPIVIAAYFYGPWVAATVYAIADFLGAVLLPIGPYHPGFTLCAGLMGMLYGYFLYRKDGGSVRFFPGVVVPALVNNLVLGLFVNTLWVAMLYSSNGYWGWFAYRLPEYAVLIPLNLLLTPIILRLCGRLRKHVLI